MGFDGSVEPLVELLYVGIGGPNSMPSLASRWVNWLRRSGRAPITCANDSVASARDRRDRSPEYGG